MTIVEQRQRELLDTITDAIRVAAPDLDFTPDTSLSLMDQIDGARRVFEAVSRDDAARVRLRNHLSAP